MMTIMTSKEMFFFSELCWGKAMMAYKKFQQRKKEESKD